jgi:oligoendopeptidase F
MTNTNLNPKLSELMTWSWANFEPYYSELEKEKITVSNVEEWLKDWTAIFDLVDELYNRLYVATSVDTADEKSTQLFNAYMEETFPKWKAAEQKLKEKLLASGLSVPGFELALHNMRADADLFREENLPLQVKEEKLSKEHDKVLGAQSVDWQGKETTVLEMEGVLREPDRETRKAAWEMLANRQLADRQAINNQWKDFFALRRQIAKNAGKSNFRAYRWQQLNRFDYTPQDCYAFHDAIEEAVVPAVNRLAERRRKVLGLKALRYFDLYVDLSGKPSLSPFTDVNELTEKASAIFHKVDPSFGGYFDTMDRDGLLDLGNRKNKATGGYCTTFSYSKRPFIFANAVGTHQDVLTLMHEGGHSFHAFETFDLPYHQQRSESNVPMEFEEVASMAMEYLTFPYLEEKFGGYYSTADAARARVDHLELNLRFWPYMAIMDAFQHWAYENPDEGIEPDKCDAKWAELEKRFRPYIDWTGYEDVMMTGWQRKDHIHTVPFYYVEYGLAMLGATQVWMNALKDQRKAVEQYRSTLRLGGTATLPELFKAAGARLSFDSATLREATDLMERTINELEESY